ncbi:iron reductase [Sistotremastrum niveocremeum HHB9708]|uniref:ferric-chelate reductase (NADPH) n=1 Tax=Sistotremastrum niveocremeum HHB9708 TaxID=1314777 RepID=A0A164XFG0_9AGAM|nr:iron reductase [Sistotremastrum niveocremeum HHB9708]
MADAPPAIPTQFQIYNTYALDPPWQIHFTVAWTGLVAVLAAFSAPYLYRSIRSGRAWQGLGIWEDLYGKYYQPVNTVDEKGFPNHRRKSLSSSIGTAAKLRSFLFWTLPGLSLDLGQLIILVAYMAILVVCIVMRAPLTDNPNRAGFIALAQLPLVFAFATKNSILTLLLGQGYEKLNFIHRWGGRGMFLSATIHGSLWIRNHLIYNVQIIGSTKETLGVIAYALLGIIVLTSLKPVRQYAYQLFFFFHIVAVVTFFVVVNYHTPYSIPWIYPPIAFYGLDVLVRMLRYRIKDAVLDAPDNQMTIVKVENCDGGWIAGQHVRLRVFFSGRIFESHPLTILNAPSSVSCFSSTQRGSLVLGARVCGDWSKALNAHAMSDKEKSSARVVVMVDGPYGGSTIDAGEYEQALLVAGGSGATFTLGILDDLVGRIVKLGRKGGEKTTRIEFAWCIRSFGALFWFAPMLRDIATLAKDSSVQLHITVFVTCLCDPESVPSIPNCDVVIEKPSVMRMLEPLLSDSEGGGIALAVSGPESLTTEALNTVASLSLAQQRSTGGVAVHTEVFAL